MAVAALLAGAAALALGGRPCAGGRLALRSSSALLEGSSPPSTLTESGETPRPAAALSPVRALVSQASAVNASAKAPFNPLDYSPEIGKVFGFYYTTYSGEKVTPVEARSYKALAEVPSNSSYVFDPKNGTILKQDSCPLKLTSQTRHPTKQRQANLRLAELAVCDFFGGNPCAHGDTACHVEIFAPCPYSEDQEPYVGAALALVAQSLLCAEQADTLGKEACKIHRSKAGLSAGLRHTASGIELRPLPKPWVDMKLDACYELGFRDVVFASANEQDYLDGKHHETKDNVLAWQRHPPNAIFCQDLACLVRKFEQR